MDPFVWIATFNSPAEYAVLIPLLDEEGVPYFFENETFSSIHPFSAYATGGIKLKVHKDYSEFVIELLSNLNNESGHLNIV